MFGFLMQSIKWMATDGWTPIHWHDFSAFDHFPPFFFFKLRSMLPAEISSGWSVILATLFLASLPEADYKHIMHIALVIN